MYYRKPTNRFLLEAARRIRSMLIYKAGGRLPRSIKGWYALCADFDIKIGPLECCPSHFTARLEYDERLRHGWFITFNPLGSIRQKCKWICHEMAEFIAIGDYPSLFDGLPNQVYHYDGGSDPRETRHRIAQQVEWLSYRY